STKRAGEENPVEVHLKIEPGLPPVRADARLLRQAVVNLVTNSLQAMPHGGVLTVSAARVLADAGPQARIAVHDTGVGGPPDARHMRTTPALVRRQAGYDVAEAESGETALSRLLAEPFDVVLTDLKMAPLDGIAVLRGALEISPTTQVIVMTGYGTVESAVAAMQQGAHDYLSKPFKEEELLVRVQRALEKRKLLVDVGLFSDEFRARYKLEE